MPVNNINDQTIFIGSASGPATTSTIENVNESSLIYAGQLGKKVKVSDKRYQLVQVDSGSTATTTAPAASLVAYWKDKANFLVTADTIQTQGGLSNYNMIAGIFTCAATAGNITMIHKEGKRAVKYHTSGTAPTVGGLAVSYAGTGAQASCTAIGNAPIYKTIGITLAAGSAGTEQQTEVYIPD